MASKSVVSVLRRGATLALVLAVVGAGTALAQNNALRLGPTNTNTYVTFGNPAKLGSPTFSGSFTIEAWFMRQGTGVAASTGTGGIANFLPLVTKGAGQAEGSNVDAHYLLGINTAGDVIAADLEEGPGGPGPLGQNHPISGVTPIQNGTWYHAAAVYDGSTWRLYLNGELEAERFIAASAPPRFDSIQHAALGTTIQSNGTTVAGFFDGTIDEARVWNVARSASDIRANLNVQNPSHANLIARWGLNGNATDSVAPAANGTVVGTNFSWVTGAPFDIAPCANNASSMIRFGAADAASPTYDDYVTFGNAAELGLSTFTIETWFKREGTGVSNTTGSGGIANMVPLVTKGAPEADGSNVDANYILGINTTGNVLAADFEDTATGLNHPVSGATAITNNNWHHAAATWDGSTWRLYLDGNLDATLVVGAFTPRSDSTQHGGLAAMLTSTGTRLGAFHGVMDEVRIWNSARSQAQIQAAMFQQLTSGTGLVARWGLGEGTGTTIADSVGPSFTTGTLTNGPTWTASNSLLDATDACSDNLFCNGNDTCSGTGANGLRCTTHAGNPCTGGSECADACNETADNCFDLAGTACTSDGLFCTGPEQCNGAGACVSTGDPCPGTECNTCQEATDSCFDPVATPCTDDGNECTDDECNGAGTCGHPNNTDPCTDNVFCNGTDQCSGGSCSVHSGDPCAGGPECADACNETADNCFDTAGTPCTDDGNVCTDDQCTGSGACGHPNNTAPCSDGLFCNGSDTCSGGSCSGHAGDPCTGGSECADACNEVADNCFDPAATPCTDDGNVCTDDECNGSGACAHPNNTAPCSDGLFCNGSDTCSGGSCSSHAGDPCTGGSECADACNETADNCFDTAGTPCTDDGNVCTDDECTGSGACGHPNNTAPCSDGLFCNGSDTCSGGSCSSHAGDPCAGGPECNNECNEGADNCAVAAGTACTDDGNVCTDDQCDGSGACGHPNNTAPCSDGDACTENDTCSGGACQSGAAANCDDANGCTDDSCNPASGCVHTDNNAPCDDANACTTADACSGGSCQGGPPPDCNDNNVCTDDGCNPGSGCTHSANTVACDDGNGCTTGDTCSGGSCTGGPPPNCDDGNACTNDSCSAPSGCQHAPIGGCCTTNAQCADTDQCTTNERCEANACVSDPVSCDDTNGCTDDSCNPTSGCVHTNNNAPCNDGNACTTADACSGGSCAGGPPPDCNDNSVCTDDGCAPASGCTHGNNSAPCDDGSACTTADACSGGSCQGGPAPDCNDTNGCTDDGCAPASGCTHSNNSAPCDDGLYCNGTDTCGGGSCGHSGDPCTSGQCDEGTDQCLTTAFSCPAAPQTTCRAAAKAILVAKDNSTDDGKDRLVWKWIRGDGTTMDEFGDPTDTAAYALCVYTGAAGTLAGEAIVPAGANWQGDATKYIYKDATLSAAGIQKALLKSGGDTKAKVLVKGKGGNLPDLTLPVTEEPVTVQLVNGGNGICWGASYSGTQLIKNVAGLLKARTP